MEQENPAIALALDEVCGPRLCLLDIALKVLAHEAFGQ